MQFVNGVRQGPAEEVTAVGSREERIYTNGILQGPAVLYGANGDKLEFSYRDGGKFGAMSYFFRDGSVERSFFDENGLQNGRETLQKEDIKKHTKFEPKWCPTLPPSRPREGQT